MRENAGDPARGPDRKRNGTAGHAQAAGTAKRARARPTAPAPGLGDADKNSEISLGTCVPEGTGRLQHRDWRAVAGAEAPRDKFSRRNWR